MGAAYNEIAAFDAFSHLLEFTPTRLPSSVDGAIDNVAGVAVGDTKLAVDGFTEAESDQIEVGDYCYFGVHDEDFYRIVHITETADAITEIVIYPPLVNAEVDDVVVYVGGPTIALDMGVVGDEGAKLIGTLGNTEQKNEMGINVDKRSWYDSVQWTAPIISITKANFYLLVPGAYRIQDGTTATKQESGIATNIFAALKGVLTVKSVDDPTNKEKTLTIPVAIMTVDTFEVPMGREGWVSIPLVVDCSPDVDGSAERKNRSYYFGDGTSAW